MASSCAILSTDQGGMPELIHDGENGLLAQSEDRASYIRCLERLIEDRQLREKLAAAARRTIEKSFTDMQIAQLSENYYLDCLHQRNGTRQEIKQQIAKGRVEESIVAH
jgi:glycosyltransferase involved in cell wall biosynthesis